MAEGDHRWGIAGVSLRSKSVADALIPQDLLYCVLERDGEQVNARLVGALHAALHAPSQLDEVVDAIADPQVVDQDMVLSYTLTLAPTILRAVKIKDERKLDLCLSRVKMVEIIDHLRTNPDRYHEISPRIISKLGKLPRPHRAVLQPALPKRQTSCAPTR